MPSPSTFTCDGVEWKKGRVLGKGSFGEAVMIHTVSPPHTTAVCKLVHLAAMKKDEQREALNEVRVLSQLRHPNIVEYMGSFEADGYLHILMEYCDSGDIDQLIKGYQKQGKSIEENLLASLFVQMCSAMRYLHERRILHRDLKAQNIFLCSVKEDAATRSSAEPTAPAPRKLIAKLGDFGISTILRNTLALAKTICGTPYYFSPELCLNRPYNNKSDIWSLGCILYEMATLKHAFDASNMKALMQRILTGQYQKVSGAYHKSLQELIDGMLQQKVEKRLSIQQVLKMTFVSQHTERMYQERDLEYSEKRREQEKKDAKNHRKQHAEDPSIVIVSGASPRRPTRDAAAKHDEKAQLAQERRQAQEQKNLERNQEIEEQRRRKNLRAAQNYDKHRSQHQSKLAELERLDDIRRRIEICSYEDQEKYVQEGWKVVQETQQKQEERSKQHEERDRQLQSLMAQMQAIDVKMQSRRHKRAQNIVAPNFERLGPVEPVITRVPTARELAWAYKNRVSAEAPWNRGREVPIGFTKESWEAHCQVMGYAVPGGAGAGVVRGNDGGNGAVPLPRGPTASTAPDAALPPAKGRLSEGDVSMMLNGELNRLQRDPDFLQKKQAEQEQLKLIRAQSEWEKHRQRIHMAEQAEINGVAATPVTKAPTVVSQQPQPQPQSMPSPPPPAPVSSFDDVRAVRRGIDNGNRYLEEAPVPRPKIVHAPAQEPQERDMESDDSSNSSCSDDDSDASDDPYADVIDQMKYQEHLPEPPALFEEAPLPANDLSRTANAMKFTLDGKTLHLPGVTSTDSPEIRIEALRVFLMDALGGQRSLDRLLRSLQQIQAADVDETLADAMLATLEEQYGKKSCFVDLAIQLLVCDAMLRAA